ncbi:hypothetical protein VD0004_g8937 [Verticillium dahliae]|nr:hypothetical protein VD0004_g8937 [Verticillium dahliae]
MYHYRIEEIFRLLNVVEAADTRPPANHGQTYAAAHMCTAFSPRSNVPARDDL